jgi:glycosyltransferase involved in cell wall biosynthesis
MNLVSVVVPVYNAEPWLEQALISAVAQADNRYSLEIVVVDDGSTDRSAAVAESVLSRNQVPYRILPVKNGGPSKARNIGWHSAKGDWIQFLDGDDVLHARKVATQLAPGYHDQPDTAVLYSDWARLRWRAPEWEPDPETASPRIGADPVADLLRTHNFMQLGSQLFCRAWLERVSGFNEKLHLIEDVDLAMRIATCGGRFRHIESSQPLFFYRQREGSLSKQNGGEFVEACIRNARAAEACWQERDEMSDARAEVLCSIYFQGARYFAPRDPERFEKIVRHIEELTPRPLPAGPRPLRYASGIVGYRHAEKLATLYRRIKRHLPIAPMSKQ